MSLPAIQHLVDDHAHSGLICPASSEKHGWCPPQKGDSRSPCPALNTMANHGYIARDGKNLSVWGLVSGLKACYNLSTPLAMLLSIGGFILLRRIRNVNLHEIGEHGLIEHNASLVHIDTPRGQKYAPIKVEQGLVDLLLADAKAGKDEDEGREYDDKGTLMDETGVARARIRREKQSPKLDNLHAEIARGEMGIILGIWETRIGKNIGVPVEWFREWFSSERLPAGWEPTHVQGLFDVVRRSKAIRIAMEKLRRTEI